MPMAILSLKFARIGKLSVCLSKIGTNSPSLRKVFAVPV